MTTSILLSIKDSQSSRAAINYLSRLSLSPEKVQITLLHVFRQPSSGESLMVEKMIENQTPRIKAFLNRAKDKLVENGFIEDSINLNLVTEPYPTITEGIIDQVSKGKYNLVVIGRKKLSKAEEFVRGDISIKLVRTLRSTGVLIVEPQ